MPVEEFFLLLDDTVHLLVEGQQFLRVDHVVPPVVTAPATALAKTSDASLTLVGTRSQSILEVVPILLLLLFELLLIAKHPIILGWLLFPTASYRRHLRLTLLLPRTSSRCRYYVLPLRPLLLFRLPPVRGCPTRYILLLHRWFLLILSDRC